MKQGPFGVFSIDRHPHAERYVFVAGGIGITPSMSMLRTLADCGDHRPLTLLYANRTWEGVTFREELAELEQQLNLRVVYVLSAPPRELGGREDVSTPPCWNGTCLDHRGGIARQSLSAAPRL